MSLAQSYVDKPGSMPESHKDYEKALHEAADHTQDVARGFVECEDGSALEIVVSPRPRYEGVTDVPPVTDDNEAFLATTPDGKLFRAWVTERENGATSPIGGAIKKAEWRQIEPSFIKDPATGERFHWGDQLGRILFRKAHVFTVRLEG